MGMGFWLALIVLIAVDMTIFVSLLYTHVHLAMASDVCPPPGAALPAMRSAEALGVHAVLIKKHLWDFDSVEVARTLKESHPEVALVCLTGAPVIIRAG